jgi:hypothetical protein
MSPAEMARSKRNLGFQKGTERQFNTFSAFITIQPVPYRFSFIQGKGRKAHFRLP